MAGVNEMIDARQEMHNYMIKLYAKLDRKKCSFPFESETDYKTSRWLL
jgi:hypothetical protein